MFNESSKNEGLNNIEQQKEKIEADKERRQIFQELESIVMAKDIAESKDWEKKVKDIVENIGDNKNTNARKSNHEGYVVGENYQVLKELLRIFVSSGRTKDAEKIYNTYKSTFYGS